MPSGIRLDSMMTDDCCNRPSSIHRVFLVCRIMPQSQSHAYAIVGATFEKPCHFSNYGGLGNPQEFEGFERFERDTGNVVPPTGNVIPIT